MASVMLGTTKTFGDFLCLTIESDALVSDYSPASVAKAGREDGRDLYLGALHDV